MQTSNSDKHNINRDGEKCASKQSDNKDSKISIVVLDDDENKKDVNGIDSSETEFSEKEEEELEKDNNNKNVKIQKQSSPKIQIEHNANTNSSANTFPTVSTNVSTNANVNVNSNASANASASASVNSSTNGNANFYDYILEMKLPLHLCQNTLNGTCIDGIAAESPTFTVKKAKKDAHTVQGLSPEELRLYNKLTVSKGTNHEKKSLNNQSIKIEDDRIRFIAKSFTNLYYSDLHVKDCLYGLCTLNRLNNICKMLTVGRKYMFLFRVDSEFTKYFIFTLRCKEVRKNKIMSGLVQKTCNLVTDEGSNIVCKTYNKRDSGAIYQSDTMLNQIEFNCNMYIKVTGDMVLMVTSDDGTKMHVLNEIYILTL